MQRYMEQLTESILFQGCDPTELFNRLQENGALVKSFKTGTFLMRRGSEQHGIGILLRGSASVERRFDDGRMHMSRLRKNDLFGAATILGGQDAYVVDIRCTEPCRVLFLSEGGLLELLQEMPCVLKNYLRYLNGRIRFLNRRLDALSKNTVSAKLLCFLESETNDGTLLVRSFTELAESLCFSRATLYRALDTLCAEGKILREGKKIIILEGIET